MEGRLAVYFYDTLAGEIKIASDTIKARSMPHVLQMALDASNVSLVPRYTLESICICLCVQCLHAWNEIDGEGQRGRECPDA